MSSQSKTATEVVKTIQKAGFEAVFAGGCVRDALLGLEAHDFDIATSATPEQVEALFPNTIPVGRQFGIVVVVEDGHQFEVATFRKDGEYTDGRRPDGVEFSSIEFDANRRDFTINALFYNPVTEEVIDFVGGVADLKCGVLKAVGNAKERFQEDQLRLLRAARFAARFDLVLSDEVKAAATELAPSINNVSAERIGDELSKILTGNNPEKALAILKETGLLAQILPEVC